MASSALTRASQPIHPPHPTRQPIRASRRAALIALFAVYLVLLAWVVVWKLEIPHHEPGGVRRIKLLPFFASAAGGASSFIEVGANLLLFAPFGVYLGLLRPAWSWPRVAAAAAGASLAFEAAQYALAVGISDVTDVIVNTAGGLAGLGILALLRRELRGRTVAIATRICLAGTVLAVLASGAFLASPLHWAYRDVGLDPAQPPAGIMPQQSEVAR